MERSRKLTLTDWTKANNALNLHFEGNKSKLTKHLDMSRTTVTNFFNQKPVREPEFRKICLALRLNWQEVSAVEAIAVQEENWIEEVRSRCCQKILAQHNAIQLLNQTEITVDQLYVDVWLLERSPRTFLVSEDKMLKSFDLRNDRLGLGDRISRNEGIAVASKESRLLILGKPGAGKTTFLKHLAVDCSQGKFQSDLIPVLIELREIRSEEWKLLDEISVQLELDPQQTQKLLAQGKLLVLMDGLDEVPTSGFRRNVQNQVRDLTKEPRHAGNRFMLTCRTQIIETMPQGFASVEVADFNLEQVKTFVENWFRASKLTESVVAQRWQEFSDAITRNAALKELTVTPVLLSLMCWVFQDSGELPSQAGLLYRKGIRLLLEKWNDRKAISGWEVGNEVYRTLTIEQKEQLLTEIAVWKFEHPGNSVLFEQEELAKQIAKVLKLANLRDGEAVLRSIEAQHGLLVERADELWSFSHLTFQEHFTIQWLTQLSPAQLAAKIADEQWQKVVQQLVNSQPADRLLKLIKQAIDYPVSQDAKLQAFLTEAQKKSESVNDVSYSSVAIRAFYFAIDLALACNHSIDLAHARNLDYTLTRNLDHDLDNALNCDDLYPYPYSRDLGYDLALDRRLALALALDLARNRDRNLTHALDLANGSSLVNKLQLMDGLQQLKIQLPEDLSTQDWQNFRQWWYANGQTWTEELRQVLCEHRQIGHDWQFTEVQEQALQRYHNANKFLVELLKQKGNVSESVCQEIEDHLLLPIATLRQRLPELYGDA
jgi:predicted NACHT family NTPase